MGSHHPSPRTTRTPLRALLAMLTSLAMVLAMAVVGVFSASVANAADQGVFDVKIDGAGEGGTPPTLEDGQSVQFTFQYDKGAQGQTVVFDFSAFTDTTFDFGFAAPGCDSANVKTGNDQFDCIGYDYGSKKLTVKFKDPMTGGGVYGLAFTIAHTSGNDQQQVTWQYGPSTHSIDLIITNGSTPFPPSKLALNKTSSPASYSLDADITLNVSSDPVEATNGVLATRTVGYTVTFKTNAAGTYELNDQIGSPLVFDTSTAIGCQMVTWTGLNPGSPTSCTLTGSSPSASGFTGEVTTTGPAVVTLTYQAYIDKAKILPNIKTWLTTGAGNTDSEALYTDTPKNTVTVTGTALTDSENTALSWKKAGKHVGETKKSVTPATVNDCVVVSSTGVVSWSTDTACQDLVFTYTVKYFSPSSETGVVTITDVLPTGMTFQSSTSQTYESWATAYPYGSNGASNPALSLTSTGSGFSTTVSRSAIDQQWTIVYTAKLTNPADLVTKLQTAYNNKGDINGAFNSTLKNTVTFADGTCTTTCPTKNATVTVSGSKTDGYTPSTAFDKSVDWDTKTRTAETNGDIGGDIPVTYTLTADLQTDKALVDNVVIVDTLPKGVTVDSVAIDSASSTNAPSLTQDCTDTTIATYRTKAAGTYCIDNATRTLIVNVGKDHTSKVVLKVNAYVNKEIESADAADRPSFSITTDNNQPSNTKKYTFNNTAEFYYTATDSQTKDAQSALYVRPIPETDDGFNASGVFAKSDNVGGELTVVKGQPATIEYTFTVGEDEGINITQSTITDYIDRSVFPALPDPLSGVVTSLTYGTTTWTDAGDIAARLNVTEDSSGNLEISVKPGASDIDGDGKFFEVKISLDTRVFDATDKETITVYNKAVLRGGEDQDNYWSETTASATSFGDEYEYRKFIYDRNAASGNRWVSQVSSIVDFDGDLADNPFIYQLQFFAHGEYGVGVMSGVSPTILTDTLPTGVTALGFVTPAADGSFDFGTLSPSLSDVTIGDGVKAKIAANVVSLGLLSGGTFTRTGGDGMYSVYVAVEAETTDGSDIVNQASEGPAATIVPASLSVTWSKTSGGQVLGGSEWQITGGTLAAPLVVTDFVAGDTGYVGLDKDGAEGVFRIAGFDYGTYQLVETKAPTGYVLDTTSRSFSFAAGGGVDARTVDLGAIINRQIPPPSNSSKTYAVGDYTWIDSNKNGVQDAGEPVLADVKVELLDAKGAVINSTTTDAQGRYLFDELEAGTYQIRFTLTKDQAAKYSFTKADQGNDAKDSDANQATGLTKTFVLDDTNTALTKSYDRTVKATEGVDPTWDAGVIAASVSVGDYVWYDANGNGRQDKGEPGIEGVTMCLVGPDGKPVTDVFGNVVKPVKTDRDGKYTFDNLPVLDKGQSYTACIDQAASKHALENYVPTVDGVGDRAGDSSTWTAKSQGLTEDGERDSTLDFGFVRLEVDDAAVKTYAIGDYVWIDTVYNAVQDRAERGLSGVTVELLNAKGKVLATTTTDARGYYLFDGLKAGKYQVRFTLTAEQALKYGFVMANRGSDDAIDSDGVVGRNSAVAVTAVFRLDDSNAALTKDYRRPIAASEGIDPTWDAGVASLDVLGAEELEPLPGESTEVVPSDKDDIAYTGVPTWSLLTLALLLLVGGGALALGARRRGERQE